MAAKDISVYKDNGKYPHKSGEEATAYKHGLYSLKNTIKRRISKRTATGRALAQWRNNLISDLGGDVSTQQAAVIDLAVKSKLLIDSIDAWLLTQPSLINKQKRALLPVVLQRQELANGLAKYLMALGLERRTKIKSLQEILSEPSDGQDSEQP